MYINKMQWQEPFGYCEHFQFLKTSQSLIPDKEAACKYCFQSTNLWLCLAKHCGSCVCSRNSFEHLQSHLQESRKSKKFHSVFVNPHTAEIKCIQCMIQIRDLDIPINQAIKNKKDPFLIRVKLLPGLNQLVTHKILGQLQNSQGHRKISRGMVGLFANKYNYSINAAIQFISHCTFLKQLLLQIKINPHSKVLSALKGIMREIQQAEHRAVHSDTVSEILYKEFPFLLGYKRKDPFELILYFFSLINQQTLYYSLSSPSNFEDIDQWDLFYKKNSLKPHHIIYSAIESTLCLNYNCNKCNKSLSVPHNIQFVKLNIPKKKRKTKEVEKQLASHRISSPLKNRRKSLMNFFKEEECPITIQELIIELLKSPLHKEINCEQCSDPLRKLKLHFLKLPDILIIQLARMGKDGNLIDQTPVELSTQSLDMGPFTNKPEQEVLYDFQSAICLEKGCLFPVVTFNKFNKQKYVIRNETIQLCKQKMNPYLLCFKKRASEAAKQKLTQIDDDLKSQRDKPFLLPDFWYLQLKHGIEHPFKNQLVCKHNFLKPGVESKMTDPVKVSGMVYEDLQHFYQYFNRDLPNFKKKSFQSESSPNMKDRMQMQEQRADIYNNQQCQMCCEQLQQLNKRRKIEKEYVLMFDKLKAQAVPFCMISAPWIKRWSNFLYSKETRTYMPKGHPLPLSIDNKVLIEGNKCKPNLAKNEDFKVLNIYLWKFLKQLYGGGPQIRYKWKNERESLDEELLMDIKNKVVDLKMLYCSSYLQSPKKLMNSLSFIEKSSFMEEQNQSFIKPQPMIHQLEEMDEEES